jgi:fucose permease
MAEGGSHPLPARRLAWLTLVVQLGAFVLILGVPDGVFGVLWPSMRATFHLPLEDLGELTISGAALYIAGGLIGHRVRTRLGVGNTSVACCALALLTLALWSGAPDWLLVLGAVAVLGLARGVIDAVLNSEAALDGGVRRLGLLHGSWAIGGTLGPLLVAAVLAWAHDWRIAVVVAAAGVGLLMPLALIDRRNHPPKQVAATLPAPAKPPGDETTAGVGAIAVGPGPDGADPDRADSDPAPGARSRLPLVLTIAAFVAYTAAEGGPIAWGYTYLIYDRHLSRTLAAVAMALFWGALTAGRFGLAAVDDRLAGTAILEGSCVLMIVGTGLFWLLPGASSVIGLPVAGLGAAAVFPMLVALMPARMGEAGTGHAVGASIAAAGFGGPVAVAVFGVLAAHLGVDVLGVCLFIAALAMYAVNRVLTIVTARRAT